MKTDELLKYNGASPCPADIDEYWDDAVAEMKAVDADVSFTKVWDLPTVECYDMYNKIPTEKEYILYPDHGHADYPEVFDIALRWFIEE